MQQRPAGCDRHTGCAAISRLVISRERFLGVPGVTARDHQRLRPDECRRTVLLDGDDGADGLIEEYSAEEIAPDSGSAHPKATMA